MKVLNADLGQGATTTAVPLAPFHLWSYTNLSHTDQASLNGGGESHGIHALKNSQIKDIFQL